MPLIALYFKEKELVSNPISVTKYDYLSLGKSMSLWIILSWSPKEEFFKIYEDHLSTASTMEHLKVYFLGHTCCY